MTSGRMPQGGTYIGKAETLALLIYGGLKESELLKLPDVRRKDIEGARQLVERAFSGERAV